jgi:hypothetical protein
MGRDPDFTLRVAGFRWSVHVHRRQSRAGVSQAASALEIFIFFGFALPPANQWQSHVQCQLN